jgi:predicted phage terminase large subunit-like protein
LKFLQVHVPATNDSGTEAFFRDQYAGSERLFSAYRALWPDRYSRERLEGIYQIIHPYYKRAQYDLVPSMGELGFFDTEKFLRYKHPLCEQCWLAVDAAQTATASGSHTALVACGSFEGVIKVVAVRRGRWRQDVMHTQLIDFYSFVARLTGLLPEAVIVEQAAGGYGIIDMLSNQLPIVPIIPRGSKEERAAAVCWLVNTGRCSLPESAPWLKAFVEELENFPLCASKDSVDAFVHALAYASRPAEFRPRAVEGVVVYDTLAADLLLGSGSSFEAENSFDENMDRSEQLLKWMDKRI